MNKVKISVKRLKTIELEQNWKQERKQNKVKTSMKRMRAEKKKI